jgi:hypothetical protein
MNALQTKWGHKKKYMLVEIEELIWGQRERPANAIIKKLPDVRVGSKTEVAPLKPHVRSSLNSGNRRAGPPCPKSAINRLMHRSERYLYSITSSASASKEGGTVRPIALVGRQAGDVAVRTRKILNQPVANGVSRRREHNRDDRCRLLCRED